MSTLKKLSQRGSSIVTWLKPCNLVIEKQYPILDCYQIPCKFHTDKMQTVVVLKEGRLSLPCRFEESLNAEDVENLKRGNYCIMSYGARGKTYLLDFCITDVSKESETL